LRLRPYDTSTEEGRTQERHRRAILTMLANVLARGIGLVVLILTLRIALPYLGQERYGVLATIVSFAALLAFLDLGIGNALIGQVARTAVRDPTALPRLVSRAFWVLTLVGLLIAAVLCALARHAPLAWAFKGASLGSLEEGRAALVLFSVLFGASVPLGAMQRVYQGLQRGYLVHLVTAVCSLVGLALLHVLTTIQARMATFLFVGYGMQVVSGLALLLLIARGGGLTGPRLEYFHGPETSGLLKVGGLFFFLQIGVMAGWGSDPLILSSTIGPLAVVVFTLADRTSQFISVPLAIVNTPLWASYAEALARGDKGYMRRALKRSLAFTTIAAGVAAVALFLASDTLFRFLSKDVVEVPRVFLAIYLAWVVLRAQGDCFAMYLNGVHVLRPQLVVTALYVAIAVPAKAVFASRYGLEPFIAASICCYLLTVALPYLTLFRREVFGAIEGTSDLR
jgi:O-antigen/teichoic acid export membrane protein